MNVMRLVLHEIAHRKLNFVLALVSVAVAVGCLVGAMTLLKADMVRTTRAQGELETAMRDLQNAMRMITTKLGFNIVVLPQDQDLHELHVSGVASATMPESLVDKLANSKIVTINHLLPMVSRKVTWPERNLPIILCGTRGEVPQAHRDLKKPLQESVPAGTMIAGYQVHSQLGLNPGDTVELMDRQFEVTKTNAERGTADDSTVWINLVEAQELLGLENLLNAILALECNCAAVDRVAEIRQEIAAILPGTQVIERGDIALARAEARNTTQKTAEATLVRHKQAQQRHERFASVLVPLVIVGSAVWIGLLAFGNVRQRTAEIGILRAIGVRSTQILGIFLGKAVLVGLVGALIGYVAGFTIGSEIGTDIAGGGSLFDPALLAIGLVAAPLLAAVASWIPAMLAAGQDPAVVLQEE